MKTNQIRKIITAASLAGMAVFYATSAWAAEKITMYQDPNCGCCTGWADHMRANGFTVEQIKTNDIVLVKQKYDVPADLASCHTAVIESTGQIVEGHVPANAVRKLIGSATTKGASAPGMPLNSPGMGAMDGNLVTVDFAGNQFSRD